MCYYVISTIKITFYFHLHKRRVGSLIATNIEAPMPNHWSGITVWQVYFRYPFIFNHVQWYDFNWQFINMFIIIHCFQWQFRFELDSKINERKWLCLWVNFKNVSATIKFAIDGYKFIRLIKSIRHTLHFDRYYFNKKIML